LTFERAADYHRKVNFLKLAVAALLVMSLGGTAARAQESEAALESRIAQELGAGQLGQAAQDARRALKLFPRSAAFAQMLGAALFKDGDRDGARTAFQHAIELNPELPQGYLDLALVELSANRLAQAVPPLKEYLRREPDSAEAHLLLGRAEHNLNETLPAIKEFQKALALNPRLPLAHYHLGYAEQSLGRLDEALAEFKKEIELNPGFYDSYWLAGKIELDRRHWGTAEKYFRDGLQVRPDGLPALYGLARVEMARGEFAAAAGDLEKVVAREPDNVEAHYTLAQAYQRLKRPADAAREFKIVAELHARQRSTSSGIAGSRP
jgi:tetratricopeptide (TPR) repeat protein